uniref:Uncharacterized protein n=1 Tax=Photobacterium damselae subsp. damselae TaxID=85581 RepID=E4WLG0_PHODD|nr:hypothetical protein [Photobacterium damselae subsp. damselae]
MGKDQCLYCYTVLKKMLTRQEIPGNMEQLIAACLTKPKKQLNFL